MQTDLDRDLPAARADMDAAREELMTALEALRDEDLDRARPGGWPARRILQHLIQSEWHYARAVAQLRGIDPPAPGPADLPASVREAAGALDASRRALLDALDGIDAASFYRLGAVGREEYSVLSVLENVAHHDREHAGQIQATVAAGR